MVWNPWAGLWDTGNIWALCRANRVPKAQFGRVLGKSYSDLKQGAGIFGRTCTRFGGTGSAGTEFGSVWEGS